MEEKGLKDKVLLIYANKQDIKDCMSVPELCEAMKL